MDHTILQDRYRIDSELGRGGMGVVYQAHDTLLGRDVALKALANTGLGTEGRARLLHEARTAARLSHPNIVTVHDAGQAEDTTFIVMELLPGLSLHEQRPQSINEIVSIAKQICAALEHAHAQEIIHRDLKPENVMLLPSPFEGEGSREGVTVKLMDFGLARSVTTRLTAEGTIMGTFSYLAPEIALGREIDGRADLYALGVMLYELTTGALPFSDPDPVAVISQHLHAPVVPPRAKNTDIPGPLNDLVVRLLAKEPEGRPDSAAEVRQTLERVASPEAPTQPEPGLSELERIVRGRFVGRETELAETRAVWHQALSGQGKVLLISGEPGIGKTRLVEELVTRATITGALAFIGASYAEGGSPYLPFRQILREALGGDSDNGVSLPDTVMADLLALVPELQPADRDLTAEYQIERQQLLDSMVVLFTQLSNKAPLLLVLEDAHWADSGSLALIRHLARNMRQQPLLIVATYREVEVEEARSFHELLVDFGRERIGVRIKLTRLDPGGTRDLLATLLAEEITPDFLEGIYRETEGNPFFVEEVCKALIASGQLTYQQGRWRRPSMAELGVPQSIQVTIQSRVRALSQTSQKVLEQAAIFGHEFDFDTLVRAAGSNEDDLIDALEEAERAQLIEETGLGKGGTFAFVHALIPTTLVASMRTLRRRRLHRRAADALEDKNPDAYEVLAYQFIEAGEREKGITYLLKAGDRARTLYANQEAIDDYQQALDYLREQEDLEQAARVQMKLALAYHNALDFTKSQQAYQQGFELWQRTGPAGSAAQLPPAPHPLRVALLEPSTLDPGLDVGPAAPIIDHLFSGLTRLSPEMDVLPDVAHSWDMMDGGSRYIFFLRKDVAWSDGVQVTAGDFEFALKRMLNPATESPLAYFLYDIKNAEPFHQGKGIDSSEVGVRALDDFSLEVELEGPTSYFLSLLAGGTYPVPRHAVRRLGRDWASSDQVVTNGPFRLASWIDDRNTARPKMVFERNPTYHGLFSGNLERVVSLLKDGENAIDLLKLYNEGELDHYHFGSLGQQEAINARHQNAGDYLSYPVLTTGFLIFNTQRPPLDDVRVRQALALATDQERLANNVLGGFQNPANGGLVPPGMPGHAAGIATPYDPDRARHLLAEAGYPDGRGLPRLEYLARFWANRLEALNEIEFLCRGWKENLGLELDVELLPFKQFVEKRSKDSSHLQDGTWVADYPDPDSFLRVALPWLHVRWRNDPYDRLVERARRIMNQEERLRLYRQAEKILIKEAPVLPLYYVRQHGLLKPWVKSFPISPIQSSIADSHFWQDVVIEPH